MLALFSMLILVILFLYIVYHFYIDYKNWSNTGNTFAEGLTGTAGEKTINNFFAPKTLNMWRSAGSCNRFPLSEEKTIPDFVSGSIKLTYSLRIMDQPYGNATYGYMYLKIIQQINCFVLLVSYTVEVAEHSMGKKIFHHMYILEIKFN